MCHKSEIKFVQMFQGEMIIQNVFFKNTLKSFDMSYSLLQAHAQMSYVAHEPHATMYKENPFMLVTALVYNRFTW